MIGLSAKSGDEPLVLAFATRFFMPFLASAGIGRLGMITFSRPKAIVFEPEKGTYKLVLGFATQRPLTPVPKRRKAAPPQGVGLAAGLTIRIHNSRATEGDRAVKPARRL